jgi:hypothetical protein
MALHFAVAMCGHIHQITGISHGKRRLELRPRTYVPNDVPISRRSVPCSLLNLCLFQPDRSIMTVADLDAGDDRCSGSMNATDGSVLRRHAPISQSPATRRLANGKVSNIRPGTTIRSSGLVPSWSRITRLSSSGISSSPSEVQSSFLRRRWASVELPFASSDTNWNGSSHSSVLAISKFENRRFRIGP